jgi:hypothetical protein
MKSAGHIGRTNKRQHIGVVPVGVKPKTLAHVAVDVNLKGHGNSSLLIEVLKIWDSERNNIYANTL